MEKRVYIDYDETESFVRSCKEKGLQVWWDGWTIVIHVPDPTAFYSPAGKFNNTWGFERRLKPNIYGKWAIPKRYGNFKRARS